MRPSGLCIAHGCRGRQGHTFPKDPVRQANWLKALQWKHAWRPKTAFVCRKHFLKTDYKHQKEERTGHDIPGVRKRWRLKHTAIPSVFGSYDNSENSMGYISKPKDGLPELIEVGDKENSPLREVSFTVSELSFFLEDGITEGDVNDSILNALVCTSPTEDDELSAFSETVRSKLFGEKEETPSISLPTADGMLEITLKSALDPMYYDSESSEDGFITISRNCVGSDCSTVEDMDLSDIKIHLKNKNLSSEPDEGGYDSSERPIMPNVSDIIVFDANEEGVETMKSLLLAQMKVDQNSQPCPSSPINIHPNTAPYHECHSKVQDETELITNGLHDLKLSSDTPKEPHQPIPVSKNNSLISIIRKSLPKVLVTRRKVMVIKKQSRGLHFVGKKNCSTTTLPSVDCEQPVSSTPLISTPLKGSTVDSIEKNHTQHEPQFCVKGFTDDKTEGGPSYLLITKKASKGSACGKDIECDKSLPKSHSSLLKGLTSSNNLTITRTIDNSLEAKTQVTDAMDEPPNEPLKDQSDSDDDHSLDLHISLSSDARSSDDDSSHVDIEELGDGSRSKTPNVADSKQMVAADSLMTIDLNSDDETSFEGRVMPMLTTNNVDCANYIEEAERAIPPKQFEVPSKIADNDISKCIVKSADLLNCTVVPSTSRFSPKKTVESDAQMDLDLSEDSETISCPPTLLGASDVSSKDDTKTLYKVVQVIKDADDDHTVGNLEKAKFIADELQNAVDEDSGGVDAVDPLAGSESEELNPKQNAAADVFERNSRNSDSGVMDAGTTFFILDDAALQKIIHNSKDETEQQQSHDNSEQESAYVSDSDQFEDMNRIVPEDCLQFDVVENDSEIILDDVLRETKDSISEPLEVPKNVDLDVHQPIDSVLAANCSTIITPYVVPQYMLFLNNRQTKGIPLKNRFELPPPLVVPDHDYTSFAQQPLTSRIKDKWKKRNDCDLKPCSVVLERLDSSVLAQYDSDREPDEDPLEPAGPPYSSPTSTENLVCFHCSKVLPSKSMLCQHIATHHEENCMLCPHCGEQFHSVLACNSHVGLCDCIVESRSSHITYLCPQCEFSTKDDSALRGHIDVEHRVQCNHSCSICPFKCVSEPALQNHIKRYHTTSTSVVSSSSMQSSRMITITSPSSRIQQPASTAEHTSVDHKIKWNYPCSVCQSKCMSEASLQNHMKCYHSDLSTSVEQPSTLPQSNLTTSQIHLPASPNPTDQCYYKCLHCPFKCRSTEVLQLHKTRHHSELCNKLVNQSVEPNISTIQTRQRECAIQQPASSVNQHMNNLDHVAENIVRTDKNQNMSSVTRGLVQPDESTRQNVVQQHAIPIRPKPIRLRPCLRVVQQPRCSVQSAGGTTAPRAMIRSTYAVGQPAQNQQTSKVKFLFPTYRPNDKIAPVVPVLSSTPPPSPEMKLDAEIDLTDSVDDVEWNSTQPTEPSELEIVCPQCNEKKASYADLGRHIIEHHNKVKSHECSICSKKYVNKDGLKKHLNRTHNSVFCPAGCFYVPRASIQKHMMTVHRSKCFLCNCNFVATTESLMQLHQIVIHRRWPTNTDTVHCPVCPPLTTNFKTLKSLVTHANQRHYSFIRPTWSVIDPSAENINF